MRLIYCDSTTLNIKTPLLRVSPRKRPAVEQSFAGISKSPIKKMHRGPIAIRKKSLLELHDYSYIMGEKWKRDILFFKDSGFRE